MSDDSDEIVRTPLEAFTAMDTGEVVVRANEALVLHELRNVLTRQAERDLVIAELSSIIQKLAVGQAAQQHEIDGLKRAQSVLLRQQAELHERQDIIASVCDVFAKKLESEAAQREKLATELGDRD